MLTREDNLHDLRSIEGARRRAQEKLQKTEQDLHKTEQDLHKAEKELSEKEAENREQKDEISRLRELLAANNIPIE